MLGAALTAVKRYCPAPTLMYKARTSWRCQDVCGKAQAQAPISFLHKKFEPIGACSGYTITSLFLPGHPIPATLFKGFSSLPAIDCLECFEFLFRVRLLHKLGDADRRLTRQDRLFGPRLARTEGCPAIPPLMAASTEWTVPSVHSFALPDTLTAVRLSHPGARVTGASAWGHTEAVPVGTGTAPPPPIRRP
jgi:hypothetical protein